MTAYLEETEEQISESGLAQPAVVAKGVSKAKRMRAICLVAIPALGVFFALRSQKRKGDPAAAGEANNSVIIHAGTAHRGIWGSGGLYQRSRYGNASFYDKHLQPSEWSSPCCALSRGANRKQGRSANRHIGIDPSRYRAQLQQAEGLLDHDRGVLKQAEIDLARYREAFASNPVAKQILDNQEQVVIQDQGAVKFDLGQVQFAEVQLSYCHITAPTSGRVGLRLVDSGNTVFAGSSNALVVITELQPITVVFNVAEDHLGEVQATLRQQKPQVVEALDRSAENEGGSRFVDVASVRYKTGLDPYLNVFAAQAILLANQQTVITLRLQQMTSSVQLIESLGGGWDVTQLPTERQVQAKRP
jgi:membrane fusion protein, multidrug efflux system